VSLAAVVVVPARNEERHIEACLLALGAQTLRPGRFATIVVLDACHDATALVAARTARAVGLPLRCLTGPGAGSGPARRLGMDAACAQLLRAGRPTGLIASTDADTRPAPDWLERQLAQIDSGVEVVAGLIELDDAEAAQLPAHVLAQRDHQAGIRLERVQRNDPGAAHHHFAGASLGVTARAYRRVGGLPDVPDLEDASFLRRLVDHGVAVRRAADVRVRTSARIDGPARRGLSTDLAAAVRAGVADADRSIACGAPGVGAGDAGTALR